MRKTLKSAWIWGLAACLGMAVVSLMGLSDARADGMDHPHVRVYHHVYHHHRHVHAPRVLRCEWHWREQYCRTYRGPGNFYDVRWNPYRSFSYGPHYRHVWYHRWYRHHRHW